MLEFAVSALLQPLEREECDKPWIMPGVAPEEATGLHQEAEEPFHPDPLHPGRGLSHPAGVEVEGGADPQHRHVNPALVGRHPALLLRTADAHKQNPCTGFSDRFRMLRILRLGQRTKRRCDPARHADPGETLFQESHKLLHALRRAAVESDRDILKCSLCPLAIAGGRTFRDQESGNR